MLQMIEIFIELFIPSSSVAPFSPDTLVTSPTRLSSTTRLLTTLRSSSRLAKAKLSILNILLSSTRLQKASRDPISLLRQLHGRLTLVPM